MDKRNRPHVCSGRHVVIVVERCCEKAGTREHNAHFYCAKHDPVRIDQRREAEEPKVKGAGA